MENKQKPRVIIDPNPVKIQIRVDQNGNVIDPITKEVIEEADNQEEK
jgi:hypothetical protein